jgi:arylsulfatase A-like enzyme
MQRRDAVKTLAGGALFASSQPARPNVLFVISDDLNNDFGGLGHLADIRAPNLDRLAGRGVRFEHAYCQYPLCNPSRVSLFSGLYPTTTQVLDNVTPPRYAVPDFVTLPQHLRAHGYQARYFGKVFHLLDPASWNDHAPPPNREKVNQFNYWIEPVTAANPEVPRFLRGMMQPKSGPAEALEDYKIADEAIRALRDFQASPQPFFLAVGFRRPHVPLIATQAAFDLYSPGRVRLPADFGPMPGWRNVPSDAFRPNLDLFYDLTATKLKSRQLIAAYYACISFLDSQLGRLLDELDRLDLARNTVIVLVADHGWHLGQKGMWAKMTLFENSANVPLIIADPRKKTGGARSLAIVESLDIYPTLVELCGLPLPSHLEGRSLARFLDDPAAAWDRPARTVMIRNGLLARTVRTARWRYTEWDDGRRGTELYDHEHDPGELHNLAAQTRHTATIAELRRIVRPPG